MTEDAGDREAAGLTLPGLLGLATASSAVRLRFCRAGYQQAVVYWMTGL
ncbi:MAG TPA: hypothetical protein VE733_28505 [Streptosporangiaceae bacterium]|jgi:hypothetical protein|nr:hypothetical protein [Streptosporangiaceae bacterium]